MTWNDLTWNDLEWTNLNELTLTSCLCGSVTPVLPGASHRDITCAALAPLSCLVPATEVIYIFSTASWTGNWILCYCEYINLLIWNEKHEKFQFGFKFTITNIYISNTAQWATGSSSIIPSVSIHGLPQQLRWYTSSLPLHGQGIELFCYCQHIIKYINLQFKAWKNKITSWQ